MSHNEMLKQLARDRFTPQYVIIAQARNIANLDKLIQKFSKMIENATFFGGGFFQDSLQRSFQYSTKEIKKTEREMILKLTSPETGRSAAISFSLSG